MRTAPWVRTDAAPPSDQEISTRGRCPRILMCRPTHFSVSYSINPWMDPTRWASDARHLAATARRQWRGLQTRLLELGAALEFVAPAPDLPDLVFTANAAVVMDRKALLAHFRHPQRQREEAHFERAFRSLQGSGLIDEIHHLPEDVVLEGAGDCVWDPARKLFWMGYGPRSDRAACGHVARAFDAEVLALELADERFYHMDTALCPLTRGELMYFPGAFTRDGLADIHARVRPDLRLEISIEDASVLAANAVCLNDAIVLSECSPSLRRCLESRGYHVHGTPLGAFARSGGSAFCLTLRLDRQSFAADSDSAFGTARLPLARATIAPLTTSPSKMYQERARECD
jgi:N-dimethylarginine dimethylaminohydrolase